MSNIQGAVWLVSAVLPSSAAAYGLHASQHLLPSAAASAVLAPQGQSHQSESLLQPATQCMQQFRFDSCQLNAVMAIIAL